MAYVDLNSGDAQRIRDQYRTSLRRDASDDEVSGWLSGSFGGGSADDWLKQIDSSGEAQQYKTPTVGQTNPSLNHAFGTPESGYGSGGVDNPAYRATQPPQTSPGYQNTDWWGSRGVSPTDIFNTNTGQLNPGWARTASGYERMGGTSPVPGPQNGNFESWFLSLVNGQAPTPQNLKALEPVLNQYGIRLGQNNARGFTDGFFLPDGTFIDAIEAATETGGKRWTFQRPTVGGSAGGVGGGALPGNQYSDQYTQLLESLIKSRIGNLQGGYDDTARRAYQDALAQRTQSLATGNKQLDQLMGYLQERFTNLQGPGYTGAENEVLRTGALDPIEQDRSAAKQRVMERLSARGLNMNSGIAQQALLEVDKAFDGMRATTQTQLATNELGRRENRNQRAEGIAAQLADIPELRAREQLDVFQALNNLSTVARNEDEARAREAISYGGVLSDLGPQRLGMAMQAAGMGGNTSGLSSLLAQIAGLNQNAAGMNQNNSDALWSGLGTMAAILTRQRNAFGGAGG